jgi:rubrerythrin
MSERMGVESEDGFVLFLAEGEDGQGEYRCAGCGYGVVVVGTLPACPMCRGTAWEASAGSPFVREVRGSLRSL